MLHPRQSEFHQFDGTDIYSYLTSLDNLLIIDKYLQNNDIQTLYHPKQKIHTLYQFQTLSPEKYRILLRYEHFSKRTLTTIFSRVRFTWERNNFLLPWNIRVTRWLIDEGTGVGIEFVWPTWSLQIPLVGIESTLLYTHTSRLDRREQRHRKCSRARKKMDSSDDKNLRARFLDLLTSSWTHARLISMEIILSKKWEKFKKSELKKFFAIISLTK